ncbi:hypothetical protein [Flavobacterium sp. CF136]|uniref:hypothetical protein n=1 Tax=Flavobacterium sp. (strain CF136) TaxID=1144313 RepID=UPI0002719F16|nr:hypothetical protein [Flavobacterium sp. CF136]EJL66308.1 hypothetical protein PMI10_00656 [Flavobacterium sp. CF136]
MNYTITNPKGIDKAIQKIQTHLFDKLTWSDVKVYGRVFENPSKSKGTTIEAFKSGKDYKDVFLNDKNTATIFFIEDNKHTTSEGIRFTNKVKVVFMVNLNKVYPDIAHRADMEVEIEAVELLRTRANFSMTEIEKGVAEVFKGFNTDGIKLIDMQPYHVFSVNGDLTYQISCLTN